MGKRKERRLAAKIGAGRRVKLDLFAEPSGDVDGSSANDEDGKEVDAKLDRELPNSSSSSECRVAVLLGTFTGEISRALPCHSDIVNVFVLYCRFWQHCSIMENYAGSVLFGQPRENPLSLLGQYSDDELDDGSNEVATNSDDRADEQYCHQARSPSVEPVEEGEIVDAEDISSQKVHSMDVYKDSISASVPLIAEADDVRSNTVIFDEKDHEADIENQDQAHVTFDTEMPDHMSSTWKMVLHEESNRYYYWNTITGETSWELPDSLAQEIALANKVGTLGTDIIETSAGDANAPVSFGVNSDDLSASQGVGYSGEIPEMDICESRASVNQSLKQSGVIGGQFPEGFSLFGGIHYDAPSLGNYSLSSGGGDAAAGSYGGHDQSALNSEHGTVDLPSHLVKNGEALLEKLKLLQGSEVDSVDHGWLSKCILEIEIRLSDISCLSPCGSSLIPFWMHSERQLNRIETAIDAEIRKQNIAVRGLYLSMEGKEGKQEVQGGAIVDANTRKPYPEHVASPHDVHASAMAQGAVRDETLDGGISNVQQSSIQDPIVHPHSANKGDQETLEAAALGKASPYSEPQSNNHDLDMDIDMEIEDQSPTRKRLDNTGGQLIALSGVARPSLAPESEFVIPPPPQEEWIPPPPPDEGIPPPPPDEPPECFYPALPPPPFEPEPMPSIYSEQPNNTYPSVDYYGNTITESSGTSFYEHANGAQIAGLIPPAYCTAIPNAQSTSVLNPADSSAYYVIQNGSLPVVSLPAAAGSSSFLAASSYPNYDPLSSEQIGTSISLTSLVDPFAAGVTDIAPTQIVSSSVASTPATVPRIEYASVPSYSAGATSITTTSSSVAVSDVSAVVSKVQKAPRMKKPKVSVASSLKSNKKVSGLVDKWKAAKEELQEEEEIERETPLEILEKKKRREIEEWRAQQIASGEAKENANFQPLGGDWRDRVKRRRAQKEAVLGTTSDNIDNGTKQPDLSELSRDLPSGWQAYWDDSSKQVYYANSKAAETTWTRPTR